MEHEILERAHRLRDDELVARTAELARTHLRTTAELVAHLAELDRREVYLRLGYDSLFEYCRTGLRLGEGEAGNRIMVARAARRFPLVLDLLQDGRVTLTAVRLLAPHLTSENHESSSRQWSTGRGKRFSGSWPGSRPVRTSRRGS